MLAQSGKNEVKSPIENSNRVSKRQSKSWKYSWLSNVSDYDNDNGMSHLKELVFYFMVERIWKLFFFFFLQTL